MPRFMKILFLLLLIPLAAAALWVGGNLVYAFLSRFTPPARQNLPANGPTTPISGNEFSILIWNLGYGALGAESDFFYDGGKTIISPEDKVRQYNTGIIQTLRSFTDLDFLLLQEVDQHSKRSWYINQSEEISAVFPSHNHTFATNYKIKYLPFPWTEPLGRITSGLQSASRFMPVECVRISLPGITDFPRKLFYLKRCMLLQRFRLPSGKDLIIINTHFEAYDKGEVKKAQMALAKTLMNEEYKKGNYVVIGGDWNIAPPGFDVRKFEKEPEDEPLYLASNDSSYMPGWKFAFDPEVPTNRKLKSKYNPDKTYTTVIDYYLVSPNIEIVEVKGLDLKFQNSDHQPVKLKIKLLP